MSTAIIIAVIALVGSVFGPLIGHIAARRKLSHEISNAKATLEAQIALSEQQLTAEAHIAQDQMLAEHRFDISSYEVIRKLLTQEGWQLRSFNAIKVHLPGFDDNELRKLLIAAGALAFESTDGRELWGLLERNDNRLMPV